ncbi:hypothetical protein CYMTET_10030 [Cymbomonas tetramitiformis]|uniref:Phosphate transporter n=1 Tax=Cymbomonas tetramitiformis TaxID=36881 RepID=A0AAE0GQD6_9CHLO|nr:hypothetical protein CYMTET_10030 [Cymbomonas tetramitiformis]
MDQWIVVLGFIFAWVMAMMHGANDVANSFATSVGSKVVTVPQAVILAGVFNLIGAVSMSGEVTDTIRKDIVDLKAFPDNNEGTNQSILGGLIGATIAAHGSSSVTWYSNNVCEYNTESSKLSCGGLVGIIIQWFMAPVVALVFAILLFLISRKVLLTATTEQVKARGASYISFLIGSVVFLVSWFVVVQEQNHPHSNGWDPSDPANYVNGASTLEVVFCVMLGFMVAFFAHVAFSIHPWLLKQNALVLANQGPSWFSKLSNFDHTTLFGQVKNDLDSPLHVDPEDEEYPGALFETEGAFGKEDTDVQAIHEKAEVYSEEAEQVFGAAQVLTACLAAFSHGANDVANEVAPLATIYQCWNDGSERSWHNGKVESPKWIYAYAGVAIALGIFLFGKRVMQTLGQDITKVTPGRGFNVEMGYSLASLVSSAEGWPVSTTQLAVGAVIGVGLVSGDGIKSINLKLFGKIFFSWAMTPLITGLVAGLLYGMLQMTI